ncbi:MAG TPA: beta-ketoacyl synthase N-terminal-like domain-containing protein [Thermoanaerobaculia bacterium]|jgi:acyl transferase domain-containing protein|nr:beta-ketoacyl synthase N-terminal-like domain-containing protein [Thermoanaerobaculia bacterium]
MSEDFSPPQGAADNAIAIVGMAGRFPGAPTLERFWENLRDGVESVSFFTDEELLAAGVDPALLADPAYVRARAVFDGVADFDAAFFGFTPREAEVMDPQHRILLECAWEALEDAGQDPERVGARAAVYAGSGTSSYLFSNLMPNAALLASLEMMGGLQVLLLNDRDFLATRLSYKLNLKGPSVLVQTACSTGLVAVHMASQSLLSGESDLAMAGAVSIAVPEKEGYLYQEGAITSPDGHCRAFDASSGGAVMGNGCAVVVLKRLGDAVADGDSIYAVIRGSAVNNDGSGKVGFTAPSVEGQADVITESLLMAGVEPASIAYVEGHGSGTALGDPIEVAALGQAFAAAGGTESCALGSVKTNVGHLNTAAGLAGLVKTALALEHATIPPSLNFERPNPQADFGPFRVPTRAEPWPADRSPRRAGVSSFGLGGTNVHAVLEEAPPVEAGGPSRPVQLLTVSARTESALDAACERLAERLETEDLDLADVAFTLQTGRKAFACRRAVVARDCAETVTALREGRGARGTFEGSERPVVFLFPGLGDQVPGMGRELYETEPVFAAEIDRCAEILGMDLRDVLFAATSVEPADVLSRLRRNTAPLDEAGQRLARTENAQPAVFAVEYALARLLMSWGVVPRAMIGYSLGEYVAATLAGVLSLEDALGLVAKRAKLIQGLPGGAMLAVPLPEPEVRPLLSGELSLAATNGPHFCVVAGPDAAVGELETQLTGRGVACLRLTTTHAFHSQMMAPAVAPLTEIARALPTTAPGIPYVSNVTGTWITAADLADSGYWARHMTQPVRFAEGLAELLREPDQVTLEVGPGGTLTTLIHQLPGASVAATATTLGRAGEDEGRSLFEALGRLWTAGARFDSTALFAGERRRKVRLPTYPFERQRYWIDPPAPGTQAIETAPRADVADWFSTPSWKQMPLPASAVEENDGGWLIFLDETGLGEKIAERLRGEGRTVATALREPGLDYASLLKSGPAHIVHLWGVTAREPSHRKAQEAGLLSLVLLAQAASGDPMHITVVANGLHEVMDGDPVHPAKATVLGALKVIHQESAGLSCASVDIGPPADRLVGQILAEARLGAAAGGSTVALRGRQRWVRDFAPVSLPATEGFLPGGAYLVTDGQHGAALADFLVRKLGARVATVGEDRPGVISLPAGEPAAVLAAARAAMGKIDGVFHTGGAFTGGLVQLKTAESLLASVEPAMRGAEAWLAAVDSTPEAPDFVLLMSSTLAFTGGLGQLDLAAAGSFLDALAQRQVAEGKTRTLAAHWDPYQWHGWLVAAAGGLAGLQPDEVEQSLDAWGIPAEKSGDALLRLLASGLPRAVVSSREIHGLIAEADSVTAETFLAQVGGLHTGTGEKAARPALSTPYGAARNEREETLVTLWQELFGIAPLGVDDSFLELGGHSLLAIQMVTQIRNRLAADLPVTALFESPTVAELAKAVARAKGEESEEDLAALLALVEGLSPDEAAEKLAEMETVH